MALINIQELTKTYKMGDVEVHALRGVSLSIAEGELVAIMGPSGSGKSTLMNVLGCLDQPSTGSYLLDGVDVGKLGDNALAEIRNQKIGFVFQQYMLLQRRTALANVELPTPARSWLAARRPLISVVVPVHNEADIVPLLTHLAGPAQRHTRYVALGACRAGG